MKTLGAMTASLWSFPWKSGVWARGSMRASVQIRFLDWTYCERVRSFPPNHRVALISCQRFTDM